MRDARLAVVGVREGVTASESGAVSLPVALLRITYGWYAPFRSDGGFNGSATWRPPPLQGSTAVEYSSHRRRLYLRSLRSLWTGHRVPSRSCEGGGLGRCGRATCSCIHQVTPDGRAGRPCPRSGEPGQDVPVHPAERPEGTTGTGTAGESGKVAAKADSKVGRARWTGVPPLEWCKPPRPSVAAPP